MPEKLTRAEIRRALKRERGSISAIGRSLEGKPVHPKTVSMVLQGKSISARVMAACEARALEILAQQNQNAA